MSHSFCAVIESFVCFSLASVFLVSALIPWITHLESTMVENVKDGLPIFFCLCHSSKDRWKTTFLLALSSLLISYGVYSFHVFTFLDGTAIFWMSLAVYFAIWTILKSPRWDDLALFLAMTQYITIFLIPAEKQWMPLLPMMLAVGMFHFHGDIQQTRKKQPKRSMSYWRGR